MPSTPVVVNTGHLWLITPAASLQRCRSNDHPEHDAAADHRHVPHRTRRSEPHFLSQDGTADRQDLRQEPEGCRHPRAALRADADASRPATLYYKKLLEVAKDADTERPELQHAKKHVGGRS